MRHLRGFSSLYRVLAARARGEAMSITGPTDAQVERVAAEIVSGHDIAIQNGIRFLLLLVPSKQTALHGASREAEAFDALKPVLTDQGIAILDLREPFNEVEDPASLYYNLDGHWDKGGMRVAVDAILRALRGTSGPGCKGETGSVR
jgi:hypothetical protein